MAWRPGDWYCNDCGSLNFARRETCYKGCIVSKESSMQKPSQKKKRQQQHSQMKARSRSSEYRRRRSTTTRSASLQARDKTDGYSAGLTSRLSDSPAKTGDGIQMAQKNNDLAESLRLYRQRKSLARSTGCLFGDWICVHCGCHNFARRSECFDCKTPKSGPRPEGEPRRWRTRAPHLAAGVSRYRSRSRSREVEPRDGGQAFRNYPIARQRQL